MRRDHETLDDDTNRSEHSASPMENYVPPITLAALAPFTVATCCPSGRISAFDKKLSVLGSSAGEPGSTTIKGQGYLGRKGFLSLDGSGLRHRFATVEGASS